MADRTEQATSTALPSVTVAIPTYRRSVMLRQTLEGLVKQDYPAHLLEILIIDNNSPDDTRAVVESFAGAVHPPRYILETQQGANYARNRAIRDGRGDVIIFGDDDILIEPQWVREIVRPFAENPSRKIGAVAGEVIPVFPDGCPDWVAGFHGPQAFRPDMGPMRAGQIPMSASLAFRRGTFAELGFFDTELGRKGKVVFGGDENLAIKRLLRGGYEVWFAPAAKALHQMPATRTTFRYVKKHAFDSARSRVVGRVRDDRDDGRSSTGYLLSRLVGNIVKAPAFALLGVALAIFFQVGSARKAWVRAWRSCGYVYQIIRSLGGKI
jgi:glycosyltransferase involved in cell wall biosynthesis